MEEFIEIIKNHQLIVAAIIIAICLISFFLFNKFFKVALLVMLIIAGLCGYFYAQEPSTVKERMGNIWTGVKDKTVKATESTSGAFTKGKEYIEKGKKDKEEAAQNP